MKKTRKPGGGRRPKFGEPSCGLWIRVPARGRTEIEALFQAAIQEWIKNNNIDNQ